MHLEPDYDLLFIRGNDTRLGMIGGHDLIALRHHAGLPRRLSSSRSMENTGKCCILMKER